MIHLLNKENAKHKFNVLISYSDLIYFTIIKIWGRESASIPKKTHCEYVLLRLISKVTTTLKWKKYGFSFTLSFKIQQIW